jgi:hypothetical protein
MSILDNFPHTCTAKVRSVSSDALGGTSESYATVFTGRACWRQLASQAQIIEYEKRGIAITDRIYFLTDPGLDERHIVEVSKMHARGTVAGVDTLEVRSKAVPDATAGLGVVYRIFAGAETTDGRGDI